MSRKHKPIFEHCEYHIVVVSRRTAREFYTGASRSLQRCVEAAVGKIEGVKVGRVDTQPDHMYISLFIPPQYAVAEVISQVKMRSHALVRKAAIRRGLLGEKDD